MIEKKDKEEIRRAESIRKSQNGFLFFFFFRADSLKRPTKTYKFLTNLIKKYRE